MFKHIFFCVIFLFIKNQIAYANEVEDKLDVHKFIQEVYENVDESANPCENFEKYACGDITKGSYYDDYFVNIKMPKEDQKIIDNVLDMWIKEDDNVYSLNDFIEQFPFIQSFFDKESSNLYHANAKDVAIVAANLPILNLFLEEKKKKSFLNAVFDSDNTLHLYVSKQGDAKYLQKYFGEEVFEEYWTSINEYIENANEVITNVELDFDFAHDRDFVTIESVEELMELIPTKHFDWKTYISTLKSLYDVEKIYEIKILKKDLKQMKAYFAVVDRTTRHTLIWYGLYRFIDTLFNPKSASLNIRELMFNKFHYYARLRAAWSDAFLKHKNIHRELDYLTEFEQYYNLTLGRIPNTKTATVHKYIEKKRFMLHNHEEYFENFFNDYRKDQVYKNVITYAYKIYKTNLHSVGNYKNDWSMSNQDFKDSFGFIFNFENKPEALFSLLETYEIAKLYFDQNNFWEKKNFADKCVHRCFRFSREKCLTDVSEFFNSYAAIKYVIEFNKYRNILPQNSELNVNKLFFVILTQNYCLYGRPVQPIIQAFKHTKEFTEEFHCTETNRLFYHKHNECATVPSWH